MHTLMSFYSSASLKVKHGLLNVAEANDTAALDHFTDPQCQFYTNKSLIHVKYFHLLNNLSGLSMLGKGVEKHIFSEIYLN